MNRVIVHEVLSCRLPSLELTHRAVHRTFDRAGNAMQAAQRALRICKHFAENGARFILSVLGLPFLVRDQNFELLQGGSNLLAMVKAVLKYPGFNFWNSPQPPPTRGHLRTYSCLVLIEARFFQNEPNFLQ